MIKINLDNQQEILNFHYENLTKKVGKNQNVIDRLRRCIRKYVANPTLSTMFSFLLTNVSKNGNGFSILTAKPEELSEFIDNFNTTYGNLLTQPVKEELDKIFYYDKWKAYCLAEKINVKVCPYCNRMYTFIVGNDTNKGTRFEFDHFFLRSKYPYLALSFFNLIPSCHVCNSNFKGEVNEFSLNNNIHPYLEGFSNNLVFSIKPKDAGFIFGIPKSYRIRFKKGNNSLWDTIKIKAAFRNITTFQLTRLYNMHKDYVDEIILKSVIYNQEYIDELYNKYSGSIFKNKEEIKKLLVCNYIDESDYHKRVLSKLTTDISKELGLI